MHIRLIMIMILLLIDDYVIDRAEITLESVM